MKFLENMNVPGYPATWCADGHSNDTHPNYTSTGNVSCRLIELPISASWVWKPSFLFARLIFYICPTLNPFIFYIISRQMRRIVRRYIQNIVSFFSLRNEKIRSSGQLLSKMNFVTVQPQFLELQPLSSSSRSAGVDGHAKVRVTMSTRQVIGLAPGLNQRYNLVACERRFRQEILQPTAQSGFSVYRHEYATYAI